MSLFLFLFRYSVLLLYLHKFRVALVNAITKCRVARHEVVGRTTGSVGIRAFPVASGHILHPERGCGAGGIACVWLSCRSTCCRPSSPGCHSQCFRSPGWRSPCCRSPGCRSPWFRSPCYWSPSPCGLSPPRIRAPRGVVVAIAECQSHNENSQDPLKAIRLKCMHKSFKAILADIYVYVCCFGISL